MNRDMKTEIDWENELYSFIHFWHAPLGLHSTKYRHLSPEWPILIHDNYFIQGEVAG